MSRGLISYIFEVTYIRELSRIGETLDMDIGPPNLRFVGPVR